MERLTTNKNVSEMGMFKLALNCCYITQDGNTRYGFALPAVSIMRLIMIDMIIARIAGSALIGGMKYE